MVSPLDSDEDLVEKLKITADPDASSKREKTIQDRLHSQQEKAQKTLGQLIDTNSTLPVTISSIQVLGATRTRKSFLQRILNPVLSPSNGTPYTLTEALKAVSGCANNLNRFDIFHAPISLYIDRSDATASSTGPNEIDVFFSVREKSRYLIKTGTDLGNTEGSAYGNILWRNIFGGAESLSLNASLGTRTRSAYSLGFQAPILSNPDLQWQINALSSSTQKIWASHEELLKGAGTKIKWAKPGGSSHELGYSGIWRQVTGLAAQASPTIRADAGDSVKSSISHIWTMDKRDNPLLPARGFMLKSTSEIAGWGPLGGDVGFYKSELESQAVIPIPVPGLGGNSGITLSTGIRGGLLYPLSLAGKIQPSRVNDRFQLGGPTDVRGFRISGLGPRDGPDAVGGDIYAAGSANLLFPIPRVGPQHPLRFQVFVNGGRLLALKDFTQTDGKQDIKAVQQSFLSTIAELANGLPSITGGVGLVYAHPVARFELNFSLPLTIRILEEGRKGLQFGVGISFL
ncbi:MAG: hypothetical protein M1829_004759 [Trizodia sp. TS-e1964]|nr:MAG: hypothetical protein M1829_004759 [Trizodia sp. TS-e1964]